MLERANLLPFLLLVLLLPTPTNAFIGGVLKDVGSAAVLVKGLWFIDVIQA